MNNRQGQKFPENSEYYLIFEQLPLSSEPAELTEAGLQEMDEIEEIRRIALEVSEETPLFMTST